MPDSDTTSLSAILLCAGFGSRLQPLTNYLPKCLMPIRGVPIVKIWTDILLNCGAKQILINTHHLSERVYNYFERHATPCVNLVYEESLMGTARTVFMHLDSMVSEDVIVAHADNYTNFNINELIQAHRNRPSNCVMTMLTFDTTNPQACGIAVADSNSILREFYEKVKNPPSSQANAAIYIISKSKFREAFTCTDSLTDISLDVIPKLIGRIHIYHTASKVIDIGTPLSFLEANCPDLFI